MKFCNHQNSLKSPQFKYQLANKILTSQHIQPANPPFTSTRIISLCTLPFSSINTRYLLYPKTSISQIPTIPAFISSESSYLSSTRQRNHRLRVPRRKNLLRHRNSTVVKWTTLTFASSSSYNTRSKYRIRPFLTSPQRSNSKHHRRRYACYLNSSSIYPRHLIRASAWRVSQLTYIQPFRTIASQASRKWVCKQIRNPHNIHIQNQSLSTPPPRSSPTSSLFVLSSQFSNSCIPFNRSSSGHTTSIASVWVR